MSLPITRPALRYFGGKFREGKWVIGHFPIHECYVEPFGGAASVLLQKSISPLEVYNDLDSGVVNFFRVLRERPAEFIRAVQLTPMSREEYNLAWEPSDDPLEMARRFYVRSWQARRGPSTQRKSGWRFQRTNTRHKKTTDDFNEVDALWPIVARLKEVQIENDEAIKVIQRFDSRETLCYVDPPYLTQVRSGSWAKCCYVHEMTDEQHIKLADVLHSVVGKVVISGYPSELYEKLFPGWGSYQKRSRTEMNFFRVEKIWCSPNCFNSGQLRMNENEGSH
jgi:DNA adenine methylase